MAVRLISRLSEGRGAVEYDQVNEEANVAPDPPRGLIFHSAGDVDGVFTIIDVWESTDDLERFRDERLLPAIEKVMGEEAAWMERPSVAEVHNIVRC